MEVFLTILRVALALVFGTAAIAKLLDRPGSEKALNDFGVPRFAVRPFVYLLPAAELAIAGSLFFISSSWFGAIGAAAVLLVFTAAMLYQIAKGNSPDCHCFGQIHSEPVGSGSLIRNAALFALAGFLVAQGRSAQGLALVRSDQDITQFIIGVAALMLLASIIIFLKQISDKQTEVMRRIDLLELVARDGGAVERDAGHPHEGLPIGARVPDFELPDTDGSLVSLERLRFAGRPVLFFFVSPTCSPCRALVPEFEQWQAELAGKVELVFVSSGTTADNLDKFEGDRPKQILLQKEREVAALVRAQWTPTAVLMDRRGRIASDIAAGDVAIRDLVTRIKAEDGDGKATYFANTNGRHQPIKIGEGVPEFSLADLDGNPIGPDFFKDRQTLVTFWSLTCSHCVQMMEELREWDRTRSEDEPALVVFSDGDRAAHEQIELTSPIVLDEGYATSARFGMSGTPSAVLVDERGTIISETAIGAADIWSLIGKRK